MWPSAFRVRISARLAKCISGQAAPADQAVLRAGRMALRLTLGAVALLPVRQTKHVAGIQ